MYLLYCSILFVFVYTAPALAFFPNLVFSSYLLASIPIISTFIILCIKNSLSYLGLYTSETVIIVTLILTIVAIIRLFIFFKKNINKISFPQNHTIIILFAFLILLPIFFSMGLDSFSTDDEIYSWNMWAVQHYLGEEPDFYYTKAAYPQLFSIFISYNYKLLGNIELQMPVRCMLVLFPFSALVMIGTISLNNKSEQLILTCFSILILVFGAGIHHFFKDGLADPLMTASLIVSVGLYIHYLEQNLIKLLWLALLCAIVSLYSKQPALIWSLFAFPLILTMNLLKKKDKRYFQIIIIIVISILASLIWIIGEGNGFYNNGGVIYASQQGRTIITQILFACNEYFLKQPIILLFILGVSIVVHKNKKHRDIFWILLIPSLLLWFVFGAYSIRLGMHVICLSLLLIVNCQYKGLFFLKNKIIFGEPVINYLKLKYKMLGIVFICISLISSLAYILKTSEFGKKGLNLYNGGKNTIEKYFGGLSNFVFHEIYNNPNIILWVPSNYIYGIFYSHTKMIRPDYNIGRNYDKDAFLSEIKRYKPDYLFHSDFVSYGNASFVMFDVAKQFPHIFEEISSNIPSQRNYKIYKLNKSNLLKNEIK